MTTSPGVAYTFTYNKANELSGETSTSPSSSAVYFYDAFRKRFAKYVTATSLYFYDQSGNMIAEETGVDGAPEVPTYSEYIWLGNRLIGTLAPATNTLAMVHVDKFGQPISATDVNKYISQLFDYSPYLSTTTPYQQSGSATITQNQRSVGMYFDAETGMNHNGFRDYNPTLGRYVESDPIGLNGGLNPYVYANGNPLSYVDRTGTITVLQVGITLTVLTDVLQLYNNANYQLTTYPVSSGSQMPPLPPINWNDPSSDTLPSNPFIQPGTSGGQCTANNQYGTGYGNNGSSAGNGNWVPPTSDKEQEAPETEVPELEEHGNYQPTNNLPFPQTRN